MNRRHYVLISLSIPVAVGLWWLLNAASLSAIRLTNDPVKSDFLVDQQKFVESAAALDAKITDGYLTGAARTELDSRYAGGPLLSGGPAQEDIRPTAIDVEHTTDANDPTLDVAVHETGFVTFKTQPLFGGGQQSDLRHFDNRYWMTKEGGRYQIADISQSLSPTESWTDEFVGSGGWWRLLISLTLVLAAGLAVARRFPVASTVATRGSEGAVGLVAPVAAATSDRVRVETFGALHVWLGERDLAADLLSRKVSGFIFMYLLARAIEDPLGHLTRGTLGEEMFPRIGPKDRRRRIRNHLSDMRKELPAVLMAAIRVDGELVSFDLTVLDVDAASLIRMASDLDAGAELTGTALGEAQSLIARSGGEFLPVWAELEESTEGREASRELIRRLRARLDEARVSLMLALGAARIAAGDASAAVGTLKEALDVRGDREDVARLLARAYRLSGQEAKAAETERSYGLQAE